jgi:hypothetical protein
MALIYKLEHEDGTPAHIPELDAQLAAGRQDPDDRREEAAYARRP